jgi:hypothetical protein
VTAAEVLELSRSYVAHTIQPRARSWWLSASSSSPGAWRRPRRR